MDWRAVDRARIGLIGQHWNGGRGLHRRVPEWGGSNEHTQSGRLKGPCCYRIPDTEMGTLIVRPLSIRWPEAWGKPLGRPLFCSRPAIRRLELVPDDADRPRRSDSGGVASPRVLSTVSSAGALSVLASSSPSKPKEEPTMLDLEPTRLEREPAGPMTPRILAVLLALTATAALATSCKPLPGPPMFKGLDNGTVG